MPKMSPSFLLVLICLSSPLVLSNERSVFEYISRNYSRDVRPVKISTEPVTVYLAAAVKYLLDVDEMHGLYTIFQYTSISWNDQFLAWDPKQFENISNIKILGKHIWMPPVFIANLVEETAVFGEKRDIASIDFSGNISVLHTHIRTLRCMFHVLSFPFDEQECDIKMTVHTYTDDEVELHYDSEWEDPTMRWIMDNAEWNVLSYTPHMGYRDWAKRNKIEYKLRFARRPMFYIWSAVAPSFIITALCLVGLFAPSSSTGDRSEKVTLGLTTLLSMAVMLQIVTGQLPQSNEGFPLLGKYILCQILLSAVATLISASLLGVHERAIAGQWSKKKMGSIQGVSGLFGKQGRDTGDLGKISYHVRECLKILTTVQNFCYEKRNESLVCERWNQFFHNIDLVLLVAFQVVNVALCCIFFSHNI